jgi:hypothetical protein
MDAVGVVDAPKEGDDEGVAAAMGVGDDDAGGVFMTM